MHTGNIPPVVVVGPAYEKILVKMAHEFAKIEILGFTVRSIQK